MKLEKINNNSIKATFSIKELETQNIDYHSFMSNSIQNNFIFIHLLYMAKKELNFDTENCKLDIDTYELLDGNFMITIKKENNNSKSYTQNYENCNSTQNNYCYDYRGTKKKLILKRKLNKINNQFAIYKFTCFDDFCDFCAFLLNTDKNNNYYNFEINNSNTNDENNNSSNNNIKNNKKLIIDKLERKNSLYLINNNYYLVISNLILGYNEIGTFSSSITEFAEFVSNSKTIFPKFIENANCIIKDNAISTCLQYFINT